MTEDEPPSSHAPRITIRQYGDLDLLRNARRAVGGGVGRASD